MSRTHPNLSMAPASSYTGRFAPSPTGPLHIGSLTSALASYLDARSHGGLWLMRMEDIDPPRELPGAGQQILDSLRRHGLHWDGDVLYQSTRSSAYEEVLARLLAREQAFYCHCSRKQLQPLGGIHSGFCPPPEDPGEDAAIRLRVTVESLTFMDALQGEYCQNLKEDVGDFVLKRRDGLYAYQLAVVIDDAFQKVTHVVRGSDLLDSTPRQIYLQQKLELPLPQYLHIPVITNPAGQKLSKQTFAKPLDESRAQENLLQALKYLGQPQPPREACTSCETLLKWSSQHWNRRALSPQTCMVQ